MQQFVSSLLRSGMRIALAFSHYTELQRILDHYAGPIERKRYQALIDSEIIQVFLDSDIAREDQAIDACFVDPDLIIDSVKVPQSEESEQAAGQSPLLTKNQLAEAWSDRRGRHRKTLEDRDLETPEGLEPAEPTTLYHTADRLVKYGSKASDPAKVDWSLFPKPATNPEDYAGDVELLTAERRRTLSPESEPSQPRKRARSNCEDPQSDLDSPISIVPLIMTLSEEQSRLEKRSRRPEGGTNSTNRKLSMMRYLSIYGVPARTTRRVSERHIQWLNASFRCNFPVLTGDFGLIAALRGQRIHLENMKVALTHPPRSLSSC